ncbi:hypothetical protein [Deinococcus sp. UR1]|uniref:hypothetical protein n=1 Tax=Deinococcus sp. UR1 TaxID=1704277 RepID=UPI001F52CD12|nr:hypothetical protein [Deinococcus sp. UR1]
MTEVTGLRPSCVNHLIRSTADHFARTTPGRRAGVIVNEFGATGATAQVLIEPSGVADPLPVLQTLLDPGVRAVRCSFRGMNSFEPLTGVMGNTI